MKNLMILGLLFLSFTVSAQGPGPREKGPHHERMQQADFTPEQIADLRTKELTLQLDLSEAQQKEIAKLELSVAKDRKQHREAMKEADKPDGEALYKLKSEMLDKKIAYKNSMQKILNEGQFEKWEKSQVTRGKGRHHRKKQSEKM